MAEQKSDLNPLSTESFQSPTELSLSVSESSSTLIVPQSQIDKAVENTRQAIEEYKESATKYIKNIYESLPEQGEVKRRFTNFSKNKSYIFISFVIFIIILIVIVIIIIIARRKQITNTNNNMNNNVSSPLTKSYNIKNVTDEPYSFLTRNFDITLAPNEEKSLNLVFSDFIKTKYGIIFHTNDYTGSYYLTPDGPVISSNIKLHTKFTNNYGVDIVVHHLNKNQELIKVIFVPEGETETIDNIVVGDTFQIFDIENNFLRSGKSPELLH